MLLQGLKLKIELDHSSKISLNSAESYIVRRGRVVFLRLLGGPLNFELMTATAGEDRKNLSVCSDQSRLLEAARMTAAEFNFDATEAKDRFGRPFVKFWAFSFETEDTIRDEAQAYLEKIALKFFEIFDALHQADAKDSDLQQLYSDLATDDLGGDVYLSDGIWLSQDGNTHDLGR